MINYQIPRIVLKKIGLGGDFFLVKYLDTWPVPKIVHANQVRTRLAGICASDLHQMTLSMSLYASIMASPVHPVPMGHEVVGTVAEVGSSVTDLCPGDRAVYNPIARCSFFGFRPCPSSRQGHYQHCFCLLGIGDGPDREGEYGGRRKFGGAVAAVSAKTCWGSRNNSIFTSFKPDDSCESRP